MQNFPSRYDSFLIFNFGDFGSYGNYGNPQFNLGCGSAALCWKMVLCSLWQGCFSRPTTEERKQSSGQSYNCGCE